MTAPILITGAQGFVGRYTAAACQARWPNRRIVGIGRSAPLDTFTHLVTVAGATVPAPLEPGLPAWNRGALEYFSIDILRGDALAGLLKDLRPSLVIHLASGLRDDAPRHLFPTNVEGTIALLEALADSGVALERVVLGSSGSIYGDTARTISPLHETDACLPADLYAVSKLAAEQSARVVARLRGLPVVAARIFNVVGAGQEERHVVGRMASQLAAIAAGRLPPLLEHGDLLPTRDFIDVRDVADALLVLAEHGSDSIYNVGSGRETPISTVLHALLEIAGLTGKVELVQSYARPSDVPRYVGAIGKLESLGYLPRVTLDESLGAVFNYYSRIV